MSEVNRREFVTAAVAACAACLMCGGIAEAEVGGPTSAPAPGANSAKPLDVGAKTDYAADGMFDKFAKAEKVVIVRSAGQIYACTAICTHKRAVLQVKGQELVCPSHGSHFSPQGTATKGPAKASLIRYGISENSAGHLLVDRSKQFAEAQWSDPASSVKA